MTIQPNTNIDRAAQACTLLFTRGLEQERQGDLKKALEFYHMSLKVNSSFFDSWLNAGAVYSKLGKSKKAIVCFQRAVVSKPDKRAFYNLASEYFKLDQFKEAKSLLHKTLQTDSRFLQAHLLLGYTYGKLNENGKAEVSIKNVLKIDKQNRSAMTALALLYFHTKDYRQSAHYVGRLLKQTPDDLVVQRLKANLLLEAGSLEQSIATFKELVDKDPKLKDFYYTLDQYQTDEKKEEIAVKKTVIVKKQKKDAKDWLDLSLLTLFEGDPATAMNYLQEATSQASLAG